MSKTGIHFAILSDATSIQANSERSITKKRSAVPLGDVMLCSSSPALVERQRDALCLSVVSFNSMICRAQSSIIGYFSFRLSTAYN